MGTEAREIVQEVPKVFTEERMAFVPQVQTHEVITHVSVPQVRVVEKPIPKIETQVREKIVQKPATLIEEVAHEYEEKFQVEVVKDKQTLSQARKRLPYGTILAYRRPRPMSVRSSP